ncbi:MAG TPA: hypothetical protein VKA60_25595 [Blastocatellia bacterium]|nr:hypothetical protein [Blastocatellia bacterium]
MTTKPTKWIWPPTVALLLSAALVFGAARPQPRVPLQKRRVVAQGRLTGARDVLQVVTWQTANPPGGAQPYAQAHLAIEAPRGESPVAFQADGGETQYLVDNVQVADLDNDGVPEIISLWQEGASAGSRLRLFHWDRARQGFVELQSQDDLARIHSYRISLSQDKRYIVIYARPDRGNRPAVSELALRGGELVRVNGGGKVTTQTESGIEGQSLISPTRPGPVRIDAPPDIKPYPTTIAVVSAATGQEVTRLQTGSDGRFRVVLPPGEYRLIPAPDKPGRMLPRASEVSIRVLRGQFAHAEIHFDSGMR